MKKILLILLLTLSIVFVGCKEEKVTITLVLEESRIVPTFEITKGKSIETKDVIGAVHNQVYIGYRLYNYVLFNDEEMMDTYNGGRVYEDKTLYFRRLEPEASKKKLVQLYEQIDYYLNIDLTFDKFKAYFDNAINDSTYITSIQESIDLKVEDGIETAIIRFYTSDDEKVEIKLPLINTAIIILDSYSGGCVLYYETILAEKGKDYVCESYWIDMETLEIYKGVITNVSKSTTLHGYGSTGPWFGYTNSYISRHNQFEFSIGDLISYNKLMNYTNTICDDGTIMIEIDGVTYLFDKSYQYEGNYYTKCIKSNKNLFGISLEDDKIRLSKLFNSDNGVYNNRQVEIIVNENGFIINSKENTIYG